MQSKKLLVIFAVSSLATFGALAQTGTVTVGQAPGMVAGGVSVDITATITAIDKATRAVTLKGPQGNEKTVVAGPEVKNFDQLKVGDKVDLRYTEALALELKKGGGLVVGRTEQVGGAAAKPGAAPGGIVGRKVTVVGDVVATDAAKQMVTVRGPQRTVEFKVEDAEQFKRIAKGDQIEATFIEAVAIAVRQSAAK